VGLGFVLGVARESPPPEVRSVQPPPGLRWPLEIPVLLTSGFGEHREAHFHNGLDLSTQQRTGATLRAIGDGQITRVRASGVGYGRSLYLALDRGGMAVFGHLSGFNPEITAYVEAEQDRAGSYEVDLYPAPGTFRVQAGDIIGYTGDSGAGPPHLHFEMRNTAGDVAMSPFRFGYRVADTLPPEIVEVIVTPVTAGSSVAGRFEPATVPLSKRTAGGAARTDTVFAWGSVVVSARTLDRAETSKGPLPVAALSLLVDGAMVYDTHLDSVAYAHQVVVDHAYDAKRARQGDRRVRRLFSTPATALSGLDRRSGGVIDVAEGSPREVEIVARDAADNVTRAGFVLLADAPPLVTGAEITGAIQERVHGKGRTRTRVRATPLRVEASDPEGPVASVLIRDSSGRETILRARSAAGAIEGEALGDPPFSIFAIDGRGHRSSARILVAADAEGPGGDGEVVERAPAHEVPIDVSLYDGVSPVPAVLLATREPIASLERIEAILDGDRGSRFTVVPSKVESPTRILCPLDLGGGSGRLSLHLQGTTALGAPIDQRVALPAWVVARGEETQLELPLGRLTLGGDDLYTDLWLYAERHDVKPKLDAGLLARSAILELLPRDVVLRSAVSLRLPLNGVERTDRVALYVQRNNGSWGYVGADRDGSSVGGDIKRLGRYALVEDSIAPVLHAKAPGEGKVVTNRRPWVSAAVSDIGAGVTASGLELRVDGKTVIAEWDPEAGELRGQTRWELAAGEHTATVTARDRVGNSSQRNWRFTVAGGRH
jgi:murein DD-endopeptidase MepM/ murein hydrolase activator NlpD